MPPLTPLALKMRETIRRGPVAWASACHVALRPSLLCRGLPTTTPSLPSLASLPPLAEMAFAQHPSRMPPLVEAQLNRRYEATDAQVSSLLSRS
jgi:hypothetical protein